MRQLKISKSITNRESASLDKYLQEVGKEERITVEQEVELAKRIKLSLPIRRLRYIVPRCLCFAGRAYHLIPTPKITVRISRWHLLV